MTTHLQTPIHQSSIMPSKENTNQSPRRNSQYQSVLKTTKGNEPIMVKSKYLQDNLSQHILHQSQTSHTQIDSHQNALSSSSPTSHRISYTKKNSTYSSTSSIEISKQSPSKIQKELNSKPSTSQITSWKQ